MKMEICFYSKSARWAQHRGKKAASKWYWLLVTRPKENGFGSNNDRKIKEYPTRVLPFFQHSLHNMFFFFVMKHTKMNRNSFELNAQNRPTFLYFSIRYIQYSHIFIHLICQSYFVFFVSSSFFSLDLSLSHYAIP